MTSQNSIGTSLFSSGPLYGLTGLGLCNQLGGLNSSDISDFGFGLSPSPVKDICSVSHVSNSLLGSSLHTAVSRSYSDSSRPDRDRTNKNGFADSDHFSQSPMQPIGWSSDRRDSGSPFINPDPWASSGFHQPLSMSKSHSEVFRCISDDDSGPTFPAENENAFLVYLKKISGEF